MSNMFKTAILLAVLTAMLILIGGAIGGRQGMMMAFIFAIAMNFFSYWTRSCSRCTEPSRSTKPRLPACTPSCAG